jgi:ankyrin repeat protein
MLRKIRKVLLGIFVCALALGCVVSTNAIYEEELIAAVCNGELDKVMSYVAQGADVNATTGWRGSTALMHAAKKGHLEIEKYLREHGATH